jgi:ubiquinone/menaquinone biosynthesis C-methylase UbiE
MGLGRRRARLGDPAAWVFNRVAAGYAARPPYPAALIHALAALAPAGGRVLDVGAGIGHLAIPLAERGLEVIAIEPAEAMLAELRAAAAARRVRLEAVRLEAVHAQAEAIPAADRSVDLVVIADALHFLDAELAGREIARLLRPGGALALVTVALADDSELMRGVIDAMERAAPRRPRDVTRSIAQLAALAGVRLGEEQRFDDATTLDHEGLIAVLRSISYIGPAMNEARAAAFRDRLRALSGEPVWRRSIGLRAGRRG